MPGIGIGIGIGLRRLNRAAFRGWMSYSDTTLIATPASDTAMDLAWTNPVISGVTLKNVVVEISTDGIVFTEAATLGVVTSTQVSGLTAGTLYYFRLAFVSSRGVRTGNGGVVSATTFVAAAQAYFAAMDVQLPSATKKVINDAIVATEDIIAKGDMMRLALGDEQSSLLWLNDPTKSSVKVNSPTFIPYKGFTGNVTNRIDESFNPGDGGEYNYKRDNATHIAYLCINNNPSSSYAITGSVSVTATSENGVGIGLQVALNGIRAKINNEGYLSSVEIDRAREFVFLRRNGSTSCSIFINKTSLLETNNTSLAIPNAMLKNFGIGSYANLVFYGAFLTNEEEDRFQDAWLPVFEHLGSDYWSNLTPTTLTATAGAGKIDLAWTLPVTTYSPYTVTNVVIQESTDNVTFTDLTILGAVTSHSVTVPTGQTRYYKIRYVSSRNIHTTNSAEAHATAV